MVLSAVTVVYPAGYRRFAEQFQTVEDTVKASGLRRTILRCADFASNGLEWASQIRPAGAVRGVYGDLDDRRAGHRRGRRTGAVEPGTRRQLLPAHRPAITYPTRQGPSDRPGHRQRFVLCRASPEQVRQAKLAGGHPEEIPDRLLSSLADYAKQPGPSSATVEQVLARPARTFAEWAADHAAASWN